MRARREGGEGRAERREDSQPAHTTVGYCHLKIFSLSCSLHVVVVLVWCLGVVGLCAAWLAVHVARGGSRAHLDGRGPRRRVLRLRGVGHHLVGRRGGAEREEGSMARSMTLSF